MDRMNFNLLYNSLVKFGQQHPVVVDQNLEGVEGFSRYEIIKHILKHDKILIHIKYFETELERLDAQIDENIARSPFTDYEIGLAIWRRLLLFISKDHTSTKNEQKHSPHKVDTMSTLDQDPSPQGLTLWEEKALQERTPVGFKLETAQIFGISKKTVQRHLRVFKALKNGCFTYDQTHQYKMGKNTYREMIDFLRYISGHPSENIEFEEPEFLPETGPESLAGENLMEQENTEIENRISPNREDLTAEEEHREEEFPQERDSPDININNTLIKPTVLENSSESATSGVSLSPEQSEAEAEAEAEAKAKTKAELQTHLQEMEESSKHASYERQEKRICKNCIHGHPRSCPACSKVLILCRKKNDTLFSANSLGCDDYAHEKENEN
ncbi:MAG: hypothetical protein BAJALOKI1v1_410001 [Promethearchaeota archaeon]|nr:MAG: hypothetical protein BAJALOKI1v1_410001 [Candidatus Lokiarchaeota archaeon]